MGRLFLYAANKAPTATKHAYDKAERRVELTATVSRPSRMPSKMRKPSRPKASAW